MWNKFGLKSKLLMLCVFMALVSVIIQGVSFRGLRNVKGGFEQVTSVAMPSLERLNNMYIAYRGVRINLRSLGLSGLSPEQNAEYVRYTIEQIAHYEESNAQYLKLPLESGQKEGYNEVNAAWLHFKRIGEETLKLNEQASPEARAKMNEIFLVDCPAAALRFQTALDNLKAIHVKAAENAVHEANTQADQTERLMMFVGLIGILFGMTSGYLFSSSINRAISNVARELSATATSVSTASSRIASSSKDLSNATVEQSASLQQTVAALEEITSMIQKSSVSATSTADRSAHSQQKAEDGRAAMTRMQSSMDEISVSNESILNQVNETNRQMNDIVRVIQEIGQKTQVINEIVFQTKLLSFNASVEAARAGEHGKGFSVVAEEVGNLAQMSGTAAKEITEMLSSSIVKVERIVQETQASVETLVAVGKEKVRSGMEIAGECSEVLNVIVENVSNVAVLSREISLANEEQSHGVTEINKAMTQVDSITQQNSKSSQDAAVSAQDLAAQAEHLRGSVVNLLSILHGTSGTKIESSAVSAFADEGSVVEMAAFRKAS